MSNHPTWPVHTFRVNTNTPFLYSWLMPVLRAVPPGDCGGYNEQNALPYTRSTWLPTSPQASVQNVVGFGANPPGTPPPTQFTLYGQQATYVLNTYITGSPDDPLILVS